MEPVTLIRYDEIGLKGKNRLFFEGRLRENVARALALPRSAIVRERGRLFVEAGGREPRTRQIQQTLGRIFGIRSFSPALRVANELGAITDAVLRVADGCVARGARTFALQTRRSEKSFPLTSLELNVRLGRAVQDRHPTLAVNLGDPDFTVHLEVRSSGAYVYEAVDRGPGGLPVGSSGRALLLLSGGIDSPVAGWMALKRGLAVEAVHFQTPPYTGPESRERAIALARELAGWRGQPIRVHVVSLTDAQREIASHMPESLWTLGLRRMMLRVAEVIARRDRQGALLTGDSLGQVASQTLENIAAVDAVVDLPVLRPLVGFDKAEIVDFARRIGTYRLSVQPFEDCCVLFAPRRPATRARVDELAAAERGVRVEHVMRVAVESAETILAEPHGGPAGIEGAPSRGAAEYARKP